MRERSITPNDVSVCVRDSRVDDAKIKTFREIITEIGTIIDVEIDACWPTMKEIRTIMRRGRRNRCLPVDVRKELRLVLAGCERRKDSLKWRRCIRERVPGETFLLFFSQPNFYSFPGQTRISESGA